MMQRFKKSFGVFSRSFSSSIYFPTLFGAISVIVIISCQLPGAAAVILPDDYRKECDGTNYGLGVIVKDVTKYDNYRRLYENCTEVLTNLEITHMDPAVNGQQDLDMSFLENIREVHGYVLIAGNLVDRLPLTSLRIIRGLISYSPQSPSSDAERTEEHGMRYSLYVASNSLEIGNNTGNYSGLRELQLPSLSEILQGNVLFKENHLLCYDGNRTIDWNYIFSRTRTALQRVVYVKNDKSANCSSISCNCSSGQSTNARGQLCWGPDPDNCQKITSLSCDEECNGQCFGSGNGHCCDRECAGGCHGIGNKRCWACRHYNNSGNCQTQCPPYKAYNSQLKIWEINPHFKYTYGTKCLDKCPDHMYADSGACVVSCGSGRKPVNGSCQDCHGPCGGRKICNGTSIGSDEIVNSNNVNNFIGCNVIQGDLRFLNRTFKGDRNPRTRTEPVRIEQLEAFKDVEEITGHLLVNAYDPEFTSLSFLRKLRVIKGQTFGRDGAKSSLAIMGSSLISLGLVSLKTIENGNVEAGLNYRLCYGLNVNWSKIFKSSDQKAIFRYNKNPNLCLEGGETCSSQCRNASGCWGPNDDECVLCRHFRVKETQRCVTSCDDQPLLFAKKATMECLNCHEQCSSSCTGPSPDRCDACVNVRDGPYCVDKCPPSKYSDDDGVCQPCHPNCNLEQHGCTGPGTHLGYGGCNDCAGLVLVNGTKTTLPQCLPSQIQSCMKGFYNVSVGFVYIASDSGGMVQMVTVSNLCRKCDDVCEECLDSGSDCKVCKFYRLRYACVLTCSSKYFLRHSVASAAAREKGRCVPCHPECRECSGRLNTDCRRCENKKIYVDQLLNVGGEEWVANYSVSVNDSFICAPSCPEVLPYVHIEQKPFSEQVCGLPVDPLISVPLVAGLVVPISVVLIAVAIVCAIFLRRQWARAEERKMRLKAQMSGLADENELQVLMPSHAKPDMACLRLCKESELRRGEVIGSGAFGTVYRGIFIPERENIKIPVAIKELSESSAPGSGKELLEEARVMASVVHPCCIRIMAVCMTKQMMLVTPLMPSSSLLDYLHQNRSNIGSQAMLTWARQIAEGMYYLESLGIVHRDLAARNVLVHSSRQVKITDFGLAKILDCSETSYHSAGGKLPIKWLALESILYRTFTHKSDVWSFGVTLWEIFTCGQRPYDKTKVVDLTRELERGERLPQPTICTIDVYMLMLRCWTIDADSRPTFSELVDECKRMAMDPARYLVIRDDKLLRLPSETPDLKEMLRDMNSYCDEGSGVQLVSADEYYLQPDVNYVDPPAGLATVNESDDQEQENRYINARESTSTEMADYRDPEITSPAKSGRTAATSDNHVMRTDKDGYLSTATSPGTDDPGKAYMEVLDSPKAKNANLTDYLTPVNYQDVDAASASPDLKSCSQEAGDAIDNPHYYITAIE